MRAWILLSALLLSLAGCTDSESTPDGADAETPVDPEPVEASVKQTFAGDFLLGSPVQGCFGDLVGIEFDPAQDGTTYLSFPLTEGTQGQSYEVTVTASAQDSPGFAFLDEGWNTLASGFLSDMAEGRIPPDAAHGVFWTCLGIQVHGEFTTG